MFNKNGVACACLSVCQNCNLQGTSMHPGPRQMNSETLDFSDEDDLSNVNVKSLVSFLPGRKRARYFLWLLSPEGGKFSNWPVIAYTRQPPSRSRSTDRASNSTLACADAISFHFSSLLFSFSSFFFPFLRSSSSRLDRPSGKEKAVNAIPFPILSYSFV